ncbi:hypothetical protein F5884DRAFT_768982 [Xylogone sp. PMI_703]|nr:hypothetical protein F5884DRAFT_768982 [Xylogone sp. PMI_703]
MPEAQQPLQPMTIVSSPRTNIKIGDAHYDIEVSKGPIPLFDVALTGIESGYRQCFRSLPPELSQHHTLCETYQFLGVDTPPTLPPQMYV